MALDTAKSLLFGSTVRIVATALVAVLVLVGAALVAGLIGVPSVERVDNEFGAVNESHTEVRTNMTVDNPNPIGAGSADVSADYVVTMNGVEMATGGGDDVELASGTSTERFVTHMHNDRIPEWWVTHVENDERTEVEIDATVTSGALDRSRELTETRTVETDLLSEFDSEETRPIDANQPVVEDPVLYVNATRARWGEVDRERTELELAFDIYNPKPYPIPLTQLGYEIGMNEVTVGEGESDRERVLAPGEETTVETTTRIRNENLDEWWVTHVENDQVSQLRIDFAAQLEVLETTFSVPLEPLTYEETVETDIWGEKNESSGDSEVSGDGDDGSETDENETTEGDANGGDTDGGNSDRTGGETTETEESDDEETEDDDGVDLPLP